ncbi:MAG: hypothetical protein D6822_02845 [Cyanobacteria bacterium J149]|nr:MAG: hypothetical protein D6822_02845 [Cyanobacteria bacterium J149]
MGIIPDMPDNNNTGSYMKLRKGENKFRILGEGIAGFEWWVVDSEGKRRPMRARLTERPKDSELPLDENGEKTKLKIFLALPVWNYAENQVQILEITQTSIRKALAALEADSDWGDPTQYDLKIVKEGEGRETTYSVAPTPHKKLDKNILEVYKNTTINLEALFDGDNPFAEF